MDLSQKLPRLHPVAHFHVDVGDLAGDHRDDADVLAGGDGADEAAFQRQRALVGQHDLHRYLLLHGLRFLAAAGDQEDQTEQQADAGRFPTVYLHECDLVIIVLP